MAQDDLYKEFIDKIKKDKSPEEVGKYIADLLKFGAAELYLAMIAFLTEEDLTAVDKIADDKKAEEELRNLFKLRTGKTPEEFVTELRDAIAKGYLFPELTQTAQS